MAHIKVQDSLDTNVIVHYLVRDVPHQYRKARNLLYTEDVLHRLPDLAITEAVYVLEAHYGWKRDEIQQELEMFLEHFSDTLSYNRDLFSLAFPYWVEHPTLSFNDCCMAFYAELNSAEPLWTFDKDLAKKHASAKLL